MKVKTILLLSCFFILAESSFSQPPKAREDGITVYVFLHENCIISQFYTLNLKELHATYADERIRFKGIFPNRSSHNKSIQQFKEKYGIPFVLQTDHDKSITNQFNASVTPEVVVYDKALNQVLYQGRIDNAYARVGKKRQVTTTSELKDALEAIAQGRPVSVAKTNPVGCFINLNESTN